MSPRAEQSRIASAIIATGFIIGCEVGGAQDGDENLRRTDLAGEPVDDHRHRVAGVIDKQLVATDVGLPHGDRQPRSPTAVQLAKARIAIPSGQRSMHSSHSIVRVTCLRFRGTPVYFQYPRLWR